MSPPLVYVDADVPEGMTLTDYRAARRAARPSRRARLRARLLARRAGTVTRTP
jgi:hypothetical protein